MNTFESLNDSICRLCLRFENTKKMVSLIDNTNEDGISLYAEAVSNLTKVVIKRIDPMPNLMCLNCLHLLKQSVYFKLQCEHTDKCFKNITHGYSENKEIKRAIAEFAMLNFYLDYKYSFLSVLKKEKNKRRHNINDIQNYSYNNIQQNVHYDTDSSVLHSDSDNKFTQNEHIILTDTEEILDFPVVDKADHLEKSIRNSTSAKVENNTQENNILDTLEEMFVPKEYDIPISKLKQRFKKFKSFTLSNKLSDDIEQMEELFGTNSCDISIEPSQYLSSPRLKKIKFKRRAHYHNSQNNHKQNLICNVCGKLLANQHTYKHHMQRHNGCRYICEHCGKGFPVLKELQIHQVSRHGTGPYLQCSLCPFKAPRKIDLMEHERIHSGERPYACEKCGLTFRRRGIWKKHLIYHSEKKVQCPQCHKKFFQRSDMLAHANNVHERVYVYLCSKCGATYAKGSTVRRHMTEQHGIPRESQGRVIRINKVTGYQDAGLGSKE